MIDVYFEYNLDRGDYVLTSPFIDKPIVLSRLRNTSKQDYIDELKKVVPELSEHQQALIKTLKPSNINLKSNL